MFQKIVIGVDGSEDSERALKAATELARENQAAVVLCHVAEWIPVPAGQVPLHPGESEMKEKLGQEAEALREKGIEAEARIESLIYGGPARTIANVAEESSADLIVIGTRGYSAIGGALLGSVTQRLLHMSPCMILCVPASPNT